MHQLSFTLDSLSRPEYESLMQGYQGVEQDSPAPPSFVERLRKLLKRAASFTVSVRKRPTAPVVHTSLVDPARHPILDAEFLEFCIIIARSLRDGAVLGVGDGKDFFYPNDVNLSQEVQGAVTIFCGGNRFTVPIVPHSYSTRVSDVPVYARLCELRRLTKDHSMNELLNRVTLWLSCFVHTAYLGRHIVAQYPRRDTKQILNKEFFVRISSHMIL